jgi:hypothetical protein
MEIESRNRWTASNATILAVAARGSGVFAAGGSGTLRALDGIGIGVRDFEVGYMITRLEIEPSSGGYHNAAARVYLGCGIGGVACAEFGLPEKNSPEDDAEERTLMDSVLASELSDLYYFRNRFFWPQFRLG